MSRLFKFMLLIFLINTVSCSKDEGDNELPVPEGTESVLIKETEEWTMECPGYGEVGCFGINANDNTLGGIRGSWYFTSLGDTKGLSNVTEIPTGDWSSDAKIVEGHSYVGRMMLDRDDRDDNRVRTVSLVYVRIFIEKVVQENGKVKEIQCKYQAPFNGTATDFTVNEGRNEHLDVREVRRKIEIKPARCFQIKYPNGFCGIWLAHAQGVSNSYGDVTGVFVFSDTRVSAINLAPIDTLRFSSVGSAKNYTLTATTAKNLEWDYYEAKLYQYPLSERITDSEFIPLPIGSSDYLIAPFIEYLVRSARTSVNIRVAANGHSSYKAILKLYYGPSNDVCIINLHKKQKPWSE